MGVEAKSNDFDNQLGQETINGTTLALRWDGLRGYTLQFPQVDPYLDPLDPIDQTIRIGKNEEMANQVLEYARRLSKNSTNTDEICRKVGAFSKTLDHQPAPTTHASNIRARVEHLGMRHENEE